MSNYQTKQETITINNIKYQLRTLQNLQQYYDHEQRADALGISSATWSLFGVVWPSSIVLAKLVSTLSLEGKHILEIGCGIALSSLVLQKMRADITASDYHPLAKEFLDKNAQANNLSPIKFSAGNWETKNETLGKFDLIIGSDVLYQRNHAEQVSQFIDTHSSRSVEVIIVDPARGNRSSFNKKMASLGYKNYFENFTETSPNNTVCRGHVSHYFRQ